MVLMVRKRTSNFSLETKTEAAIVRDQLLVECLQFYRETKRIDSTTEVV